MRAVAERFIPGMFAAAPFRGSRLLNCKDDRTQAGILPLVTSVTEGLRCGKTAGAPGFFCCFCFFQDKRPFLGDIWLK